MTAAFASLKRLAGPGIVAWALAVPALAPAAPFVPTSDEQVLATVPARSGDPRARELAALREAWRGDPKNLRLALDLATGYFDEVAAEGDPRYIGYAQAALAPWWNMPDPPTGVRVLRAMLLQFDHRFDEALADLDAALRADPTHLTAAAWRTAIQLVRADYEGARSSCAQMAALAVPLLGAACRAQVDATTGKAAPAAAALRVALAKDLAAGGAGAGPEARLWSLTRLAEIEERRGEFDAAESAFRAALALPVTDVYLLAAYADYLLDRGRYTEVLALLKGRGRADVLLLRLALAARAAGDPAAERYRRELAARFEAAARRGDTSHRKEESRFVLALQGQTARALLLARENYAQQREPADARILLEAALAARDPAAAQPALDVMARSGIESVALQQLAQRLKALQ